MPPARRRGWLTEQCRRRGDDERELWRALARYRQTGAAGLLTADRPRPTRFGRSHELVREGVLTRLIDAPRCVLGEFGPLAQLLEELGDRLAFLCRVLEFFLDPSRALEAKPITAGDPRCCCKSSPRRSNGCARSEQGPCLSLHEVCATTAIGCAGVPSSTNARTSNDAPARHRVGNSVPERRGGVQ